MAGLDHAVQQVVVVGVDVEQVHARCRHHHVAGGEVGHPDHALEHHARLRRDQLLLLGFGERLDQLVTPVPGRGDQLDDPLEQAAPVVRGDDPAFTASRRAVRMDFGHSGAGQDAVDGPDRGKTGDRKLTAGACAPRPRRGRRAARAAPS